MLAFRARYHRVVARERLRLGIVGCGDVAHRHYLPALWALADKVELRAFTDPRPGAAERAAAAVVGWSPGARTYTDLDALLRDGDLDAIIDLTPAPQHAAVNQAVLDAGINLYSEKPIAGTIGEADRLISTASERRLQFLCAPGVAVTERFRWLADVIASGIYGVPTLAVMHHADPGPAAWREYTGDPSPFYREGVGPVFDHGVYRLHGVTMVLGPVRRVQAMGAISSPTRIIRGGPRAGERIDVTTPDHVLINLEFASGALGQLLASFGAASTLAPWFELHLSKATISFGGQSHDKDAPVSIYLDDDSPAASEGWTHNVEIPRDDVAVVEAGIGHFVAVLRGESRPVLTAEHARHILDVTLKAYASIGDGRAHDTETTFQP
jgi:predicted dehydrogenase